MPMGTTGIKTFQTSGWCESDKLSSITLPLLALPTVQRAFRVLNRSNLSKLLYFISYSPFLSKYRDSDTNTFPLYASGRENLHYVHFNLELKKRQDFIQIVFSFLMCRSLFRSPVPRDSVWLEIPIDRGSHSSGHTRDKGERELVSEVLIVPRYGYYFEQIVSNMPHVGKLLKPRIPAHVCAQILRHKDYPLIFLSEN